ncbi:histidinol dehydrogenase [Polymorphobacter sp. PAMC 29334]|uniref:histidinol dehydrogenase n=1 Tax=Polymorphobacter sp. PAMC 29334 TaxID=2862331 RepID=UPI001C77AD3A|nr:histidinol dehydrogenase [Polymorphobacter sp. PAMC 29334]QYE35693.1 histidinol dehydrogenase [Polymorphobacter sp. PAMC 29334]
MPLRLDATAPGFSCEFKALVDARRESDAAVSSDVAAIIADVRARGDVAVAELTAKFDRIDLNEIGVEVSREEIAAARSSIAPDVLAALELAAERIRAFHAAQRPVDLDTTDSAGIRLGYRWSAVAAAGLYVPGGLASYPSSVLMNAIPAKVSGVGRVVMVTPTPGGRLNPLVLAAAELAGVDQIFRIGGAQAIAALAYGTENIDKVDKIVGPGNAWVAEAKRQVFGVVGIDMVAGPSEVVVISDDKSDPEWVAADLLAQAEHDAVAQSILITDSAAFGDAVAAAVERQLLELATQSSARASWEAYGTIIVVPDFDTAIPLIDALAAEHLQIMLDDPDALFQRVSHAGSVFLGRHTPEAVGDYVAGPNHVLPTGRRARFSSGLSVTDFMKRTTFLGCDAAGLAAIGPAAVTLATAEGLPAHANSVRIRLG